MTRVRAYAHLREEDLQVELSWQLREVSTNSQGHINWRAFTLGKALFECLCEAQNWRCCYCGMRTIPTRYNHEVKHRPTLEHVVPLSWGGADHPDNMVMACLRCNNLRGSGDLQAFLRVMKYYRWNWGIGHAYDDYPIDNGLSNSPRD